MFKIPPATLSFWNRLNIAPATEAQIAEVRDLAPGPLPDDYVAFLQTYGFCRWMLIIPDRFEFERSVAGQSESRTGSVAHLETPESIARAMKHAWSDQPEMGLPCWPQGVMPVAGNAGADQVLMDFGETPGAILFWTASDDPW